MADITISDAVCDRCGYATDEAWVNDPDVVDDPRTATGALCPDWATDDDANHLLRRWLLTWG